MNSEQFFEGAERRAARMLVALGILAALPLLLWRPAFGLGFVLGAAAAYLNFIALKRLAARFVEQSLDARGSGASVVVNYFFRLGLLALAGYAIFSGSASAGYGFLAGLFLPVAALACEAFYEAYVALRRGL